MSSNKLNTHFYDGKLKERYSELQQKVNLKETFPDSDNIIGDCIKEIRDFFKQLGKGKKQKLLGSMNILNILERDIGKPPNNDTKNNIKVDDLLPLVWARVRKYDECGKILFLEQMMEIKNGMCSQGRTTRLIQMADI